VVPHKFPDTHMVNGSAQLQDLQLWTYLQQKILQHARLLLEAIVTDILLECWVCRWSPLLTTKRLLLELFWNGSKTHLKPEKRYLKHW